MSPLNFMPSSLFNLVFIKLLLCPALNPFPRRASPQRFLHKVSLPIRWTCSLSLSLLYFFINFLTEHLPYMSFLNMRDIAISVIFRTPAQGLKIYRPGIWLEVLHVLRIFLACNSRFKITRTQRGERQF